MEPLPEPDRIGDLGSPADSHPTASTLHSSEDEREATELSNVTLAQERDTPSINTTLNRPDSIPHWYDPIKKFWRHNIRISVPHLECRDHLANERTFLAYLRTSLAFSILGVLVAQLYRLQHTAQPDPTLGFYVLSKPIAVVFQVSAIGVALLGAIRFFRQQHSMSIGRVHAGGWELTIISVWSPLVLISMFVLHVVIGVRKDG